MTETIITGRREGLSITVDQDINWGDLSSSPYGSWSNWTSWKVSTGLTVSVQIDDDKGSIDYRVPAINVNRLSDTMTVSLKISDTGTFTGEETTINFVEDTPVTYVGGRYYRWTVTLTGATAPYLFGYATEYSTALKTQTLEDVDVFGSYTTDLTTDLGLVRNIQATALQGDPYVVDDYVELLESTRTEKTLSNPDSVTIDTATKKFGTGSFYYDADRDLTTNMGSDMPTGTDNFTWEAWVYCDSAIVPNGAILSATQAGGQQAAIYAVDSGTEITFDYDIRIDSTTYGTGTVGVLDTVPYDTWAHVALVRNGSSLKLYVNGVEQTKLSGTIAGAGIIDTLVSTLYIGSRDGSGSQFRGNIDEVRISNSARYTSAFTPQDYPFYNDSTTTLLLHADDFTDDNGTDFGSDEYIIVQSGGSPVIKQKNPPQVEVVDYSGNPWDGTVDVVLRGLPKVVYDGFAVQPVNIEGII